MAISFVAAGTVATGVTPSVGVPAGIAAGDLLLIVSTSTATPATPTGWKQVSAEGAGQFVTVFSKFAGSSETATTVGLASVNSKAVMLAYRGNGAFEAIPAYTTGTSTTATPNTLTTTYANDFVINIYSDVFGAAATWTANASTTSRVNSASTTSINGLLIADELQAVAGVSTARAATISTSRAWNAIAIALVPQRTVYWVGGAGTWNATTKTNWSDSTGGTGGVITPSDFDNVVFDTSSGTGTITVTSSSATCSDMTSSATQALTFSGALSTCYGNMTLTSGAAVYTAFDIVFTAATTGKTITTNSESIGSIEFNGSGGGWTLGSAFISNLNKTITFTNGTFSTGNFALTTSRMIFSGTGTTSVSLGSSAITLSASTLGGVFTGSTTGLTFNAGTSSITVTGSLNTYGGYLPTISGTVTFYDYDAGSMQPYSTANSGCTTGGAYTFRNLTIGAPAYDGTANYNLAADITVTGTLTCAGSSGIRRVVLRTNSWPTQRTITAAAVSLNDTDFSGIIGAGTATWSGTRIGNGLRNSNISFTAPKTVYWNLSSGGTWGTSNAWATTSGGSVATTNAPLPQDTAIIGNTGLNSGASIALGTTTAGGSTSAAELLLPNIDMSNRTSNMTLNSAGSTAIFCGNFSSPSGGTLTLNANFKIQGTCAATFNAGTISATSSILTVNQYGTLTHTGTMPTFSSIQIQANGSLTLSSNVSTGGAIYVAGTIAFGTYKMTTSASGGGFVNLLDTAVLTGTPVFESTYSGASTRTLRIGSAYASLPPSFIVSGSGSFTYTASTATTYNFNDLDFTGFTGSWDGAAVASTGVYGNITLSSGMTISGTNSVNFRATSGTKTITSNGKTVGYFVNFNGVGGTWVLADNMSAGSSITLTNGTLNLNGKSATSYAFVISTGTKNLTFNGGSIVCTGTGSTVFQNVAPTGFTSTAGTGVGKISMTSTSAKTFAGAGSTYNCTLENAGAGVLTISGANTFNDISNSVSPASFVFPSSTTTTVNNFSVSGTAGNLVTITPSSAGVAATLSKSSGIVSCNYLQIQYSTATGGATWYAGANSTNVAGNTGWIFSSPSTGNGLFFGSNF